MLRELITLYHETLRGGDPAPVVQTASTSNVGTLTVIGVVTALILIFVLILYSAKKDLDRNNSKKK